MNKSGPTYFLICGMMLIASLFPITLRGQDTIIKVHKDSLVILHLNNYRGDLQWQISEDGTSWFEIPDANNDSLLFTALQNIYYRVGVKEQFCDWHFGKSILIQPVFIPTVVTSQVTIINEDSVKCSGDITHAGNDTLLTGGFCWSLNPQPDTTTFHLTTQTGPGFYSDTITGLMPDTTYYFRAFALNWAGIAYGEQLTVTTSIFFPKVSTSQVTGITDSTAICGGVVEDLGGSNLEKVGICWGTTELPDTLGAHCQAVNPVQNFECVITNLNAVSTYYTRAYAVNGKGLAYGPSISFTTPAGPPDLITSAGTEITAHSAVTGGEVTSEEGAPVTRQGVCWSVNPYPDLTDNKIIEESGAGVFSVTLSGLDLYTSYYVRAFAINDVGTGYGNQVVITTLAELPAVTTQPVTSIDTYSATSGGKITYYGGATITQRGVCWDTLPNPDTGDFLTIEQTNNEVYTSNLTNLLPHTTYYVRAYAINAAGVAYGRQYSFTTLIAPPTTITYAADEVTFKSASLRGEIRDEGGGHVTENGFCWSTTTDPDFTNHREVVSDGSGTITTHIVALKPGTTYYVKAYAINETGTKFGNQTYFVTSARIPNIASTAPATNISSTTAESGGNIVDNGGASLLEAGVCYSTSHLPDIGDSKTSGGNHTGNFTVQLTGLAPNTQYYIRSYAVNSAGTAYGPEKSFMTRDDGSYRNNPVLIPEIRAGFKGWLHPFPDQGSSDLMGFSGSTFDWEREQVYIVGNNAKYIWVINAPGYGKWSDDPTEDNLVKSIQLQGFTDPECISYLGNSWLMIGEEEERKIYFFEVTDPMTVINKSDAGVILDPTELFSLSEAKSSSNQLEGVAFDFFNRKIIGLCEIGSNNHARIFMWNWNDTTHRIEPGTRVEITNQLENFTQDFPEASELYFSPLYRRLYVTNGAGNHIAEYDFQDPASLNFGLKIGEITEPLSQGDSGTDLGDLEGFCLSRDGRYLYLGFEDKSFGYAPLNPVRNPLDNTLNPTQYPFAGTPGTTTHPDPLHHNDPEVYLSYFDDGTSMINSDMQTRQWEQLTSATGNPVTTATGVAYDEISDRIYLLRYENPSNPLETFIDGFDQDKSAVFHHTLYKGFGLKPDGSMKPAASQSSATDLFIEPFHNQQFIWGNGLDGSVLMADLPGSNDSETLDTYLADPRVSLLYKGLDAGVVTSNQYQGMAVDLTYRNAVWITRQSSLLIDEFRNHILARQINLSPKIIKETDITLGSLINQVKGLYYNAYADHLFILGYDSAGETSYIFEMNMADRSVIGYLELTEAYAEGITMDPYMTRLIIVSSGPSTLLKEYER